MRTPILTISLSAALLVACDTSPTRPTDRVRVPDKPLKQLEIVNPVQSWTMVALPFSPAAINDGNVIVGSKAGEAVRWQNGALTTLPHLSGVAGPYSAVDVTPNGVILGEAGNQPGQDGHGLYWSSATAQPVDISAPTVTVLSPLGVRLPQLVQPVAMNDNYVIVGNVISTGQAFRWTSATGIRNISPTSSLTTVAGLGADGYAAGNERPSGDSFQPLRWDANGVATALNAGPSGMAADIDDAGNVIGTSSVTGPTMTRIWHLDGSVTDLSVGFNDPGKLSDVGRIVEQSATQTPWTYFAGVLTHLSAPFGVQLVGVNKCGSIIGKATDGSSAGFLWVRTNGCDVSNPPTPTPTL